MSDGVVKGLTEKDYGVTRPNRLGGNLLGGLA